MAEAPDGEPAADPDGGSAVDIVARAVAAAHEREIRRRRRPEGAGDATAPRSGWLEDEDLYGDRRDRPEAAEDRDRRRRVFTRQVCVRLSWGQFGELEAAADLYGVPRSTMARILVRRGARAVLEHHRRYDLEQGDGD